MTPFSFEYYLALFVFAFAAAMTPGPNNVMLLASGVNFGFRRTVPHITGIVFGFPGMVLVIGLALSGLFGAFSPDNLAAVLAWLKWIGAAYLLYLAWRIATAGEVKSTTAMAKPFTALQAAAFQWVNPKGWTMALAAQTTYSVPSSFMNAVLSVTAIFFINAIVSASSWALFGTGLRRLLEAPTRRRIFNITMAVLLIASITPVFFL